MKSSATFRVVALVGSTALAVPLSRPAAADPPSPPASAPAEPGDATPPTGSATATRAPATTDPGDPSPGVHLTIGEIVYVEGDVRGPLRSYDVVTSVDILAGETAQRSNANESLEVMRRAPAVYVESFNQGIISGDIGIRGFNTQGDIGHTKLLVDGIPSNLHIGYPDLKAVSPLEIERLLTGQPPAPPSESVGERAGDRSAADAAPGVAGPPGRPRELARRLAGDLDAIVLQGLRSAPAERYGSVERFAADVERYQRGLPVAARRGSWPLPSGRRSKRRRKLWRPWTWPRRRATRRRSTP